MSTAAALSRFAEILGRLYPPLMRGLFSDGGRELITMLRRVKELGVTTSLDMSLPDAGSESGQVDWSDLLQRLLPYVDLFLPSVEELMFMVDRASFECLNRRVHGGDLLDALELDMLNHLGDKMLSLSRAQSVRRMSLPLMQSVG